MSKQKRLLVVADDFGVSSGVNRSVEQLHGAGVVSAAALVVTGDGAEEAIQSALEVKELDVGLHFTLAAGRPMSPPKVVGSLVREDGNFLDRKALIRALLARRISEDEIRVEFTAQLSALERVGVPVRFINSDQHVHVLPVVRKVVADEARRRTLPVRIPREVLIGSLPSKLRAPHRLVIKATMRTMAARFQASIPPVQRYLSGSFLSPFGSFPRPDFSRAGFVRLLDNCVSGTNELMVHPAFPDEPLATFWRSSVDRLSDRELEHNSLASSVFLAVLRSRDIAVIRFRDLA